MKAMRPRALLLATTAATALADMAIAAPNLVTNGDFETGLTGWSVSCPFGVCISTAGGNPGNAYQGYNNDVNPGSLSQTVVTAPGIYQIGFDYKESVLNANNSLSMQLGAASTGPLPLTTSYQASTSVFAVGAPNPTLTFLYKTVSGSGVLRVDNVFVVEVDDGAGNNLGAASQTIASQMSREFMDRLFDRFGHSGSPMDLASAGEPVVVASNDGMTYINGPGNYRASSASSAIKRVGIRAMCAAAASV